MADSFSIKFDTAGLDAALDQLGNDVKAETRPAAQAGAQVFYEEVRARVPVSKEGHWFYGTSYKINGQKYWFDSGSLKAAIYQVFSADNSDDEHSTYHVAWNHKTAPYGAMVEYGTSRAPAHPFVRPAFDAAAQRALKAAQARFEAGAQQVIAKLK